MSTSTFYTIFWILYFPLCIAFYAALPSLQYSDELLTLALIFFTMMKSKRLQQRMAKKEIAIYIGLMVFFVVYSLIMAVNVRNAVWLDLQQQVRPYAVFYCTWLLCPQLSKRQKSIILWTMLITYGVYVGLFLFMPGTVTLGRTTESAAIGQLALVCSSTYYLFKPRTRRNLYIALILMAVGLLGGKSKFYGEMVVFVAIFCFLKGRIKLGSVKTILQFTAITALVLYFTWYKFNAYYIEGMAKSEGFARVARPESYKTAATIMFKDYVPLGSGLGTFATNAAAEYYSPLYYKYHLHNIWGLTPRNPMFVADAYYPTLAEFGILGLIFFFLFWKRRLNTVLKVPDDRYYKVGLMCILALLLESTADTSYLSGKGMGYFMLLAMCLSSKDVWLREQQWLREKKIAEKQQK